MQYSYNPSDYTSSDLVDIDAMQNIFNCRSNEFISQNPIAPKKRHTNPQIIVGIAILVAVFLVILIVKRHQLNEIDEDGEEL